MKLRYLIASCVIALAGCATTGGSPNATDADIVQGLSATYDLAVTLYKAGKLTDDQAQSAEDALLAASAALKASRSSAVAGDSVTSAAHLRAASAALAALTAQLTAAKGK